MATVLLLSLLGVLAMMYAFFLIVLFMSIQKTMQILTANDLLW